MSKQYTGKDFTQTSKNADAVGIEDLDGLADRSMPLCMRVLHKALRREHKLKHWGRLQYGAFLRARLDVDIAVASRHATLKVHTTSTHVLQPNANDNN